MRLLKTLKALFDVPEVDSQDPDVDLMVYMAVSLGKSDILISVLLPLCVRPQIRAQLVDREVSGALVHLCITGVYFARKEKEQRTLPHYDGYLSESTESLSSTVTNDSTFEKPTVNYLNPRMRSITGEIHSNGYSRVDGDGNSFSGNQEDHVVKTNGFTVEKRPQMDDLNFDRRTKNYDKLNHSELRLATQKNYLDLDREVSSSEEGLVNEKLIVVDEPLHEKQGWQKGPESHFGFVANYHQKQDDVNVYENSKKTPVAVTLKSRKAFSDEEIAQTGFQSETKESIDHPIRYSNEQPNSRDITFKGAKYHSRSDQPKGFDNERSLPLDSLDSFKMARTFSIVAKRAPEATNPGFSVDHHDNAVGNKVDEREIGVTQQLETVDQNGNRQLEYLSHQSKGENNRVSAVVMKEYGNADKKNSSTAGKDFLYQEAEPETSQWYMQKDEDSGSKSKNVSQYPHQFVSDTIEEHRLNFTSHMDQDRPELYNDNLSPNPYSYNVRVPTYPKKHNRESHPFIVQLPHSPSDQVKATQPFELNRESQELMDQVPSTLEEEQEKVLQSPTLYTQYKDERVGYLEGHPQHSIIFMKADSDALSEPHMEYEDSVFTDSSVKIGYDSDTESHRGKISPPPYHPPPDYKKAKQSLKRKSHKSGDETSSSSGNKLVIKLGSH